MEEDKTERQPFVVPEDSELPDELPGFADKMLKAREQISRFTTKVRLKIPIERAIKIREFQEWYRRYGEICENSQRVLIQSGYAEYDKDDYLTARQAIDTDYVCGLLQIMPGYGPFGAALKDHIRNGARDGTSVRNKSVATTAHLSGLAKGTIRNILSGDKSPTVDEAAKLALAYGITTGELLGIVDADEVRLLKAWRSASDEGKEAILTLLEQLHKPDITPNP